MRRSLDQTLGVEDKTTKVWMTVLALAILETKFRLQEERVTWSLVVEKAMEVCY